MTSKIRMAGIRTGTPLGVVGGAIPSQGLSGTLAAGKFKKPDRVTGQPFIVGQVDWRDSTVHTTGLSNVSAYDWRIVGGATISTTDTVRRGHYPLATSLTGEAETSVVVSEAIPAGTPATGNIIVVRDTGTLAALEYASWSGSTFTLKSAADFRPAPAYVGSATAGNTVGIILHSNQWIECRVTADPSNTVYVSQPVLVYGSIYMGTADTNNMLDDEAVLALVPYNEVTHVAVADGAWSNPATWNTGTVPKSGAFPVIPRGRNVVYDNEEPNVRLDRIRVDGTLRVDTTSLTTEAIEMFVETIVGTRMSTITIGTSNATRVPVTAAVNITFSGKDYSADSFTPTDMKASTVLATRGWGRGLNVHGTIRMWGAKKTTWGFANAPVPQGAISLTMEEAPVGAAIGDTIIIGATTPHYEGAGTTVGTEDEYRVLTGVSGSTLSWDEEEPLEYPHDNQSATSTRTDIAPVVAFLNNKNITLKSEHEFAGAPYRRAHAAAMHHHTIADIWDVDFFEMGRTDKSVPAGVIDGNGDHVFYNGEDPRIEQYIGYYVDATIQTYLESIGYIVTRPGADVTAIDVPDPNTLNLIPVAVNGSGQISQALYEKQTEPLTPRSNLQSRYGIHIHHAGFGQAEVPLVNNCCVDGSPGWAGVHHSCEANMDNNVFHRFYGSGLVSESGDEVGSWVGNLAIHTTFPNLHPTKFMADNVKSLETSMGIMGDLFRWGYGFAFRGRAMRTNRNWAVSCGNGHVFFHRDGGGDPNQVVPPKALRRDTLDLEELARIRLAAQPTTLPYEHYPIVHFDGNGAMACISGGYISKPGPKQSHDVNIRLRNLKSYGCLYGFGVEYIGNYIIENFDCVGPAPAGSGIVGPQQGIFTGGNVFQLAIHSSRVDGYATGVFVEGSDSSGGTFHDQHSQEDPRFMLVGLDIVNCAMPVQYTVPGYNLTTQQVTYVDDDWGDTAIDVDLEPSDTFKLTIASFGGPGGTAFPDDPPSNDDGKKIDSIGSLGEISPKPWGDTTFPINNSEIIQYVLNADFGGYYQYDSVQKIVFEDLLSDRLTGRAILKTRMLTTLDTAGYIDRGPLTYSTTPVVQANKRATVARNGSIVINMLTGAMGGGGAGTHVLKDGMSVKPNHGLAVINAGAGTITYTPDVGYTGTDDMVAFVGSQGQYATVRIDILIGSAGTGLTAPAVAAHFSVADGGGQSIDVILNTPPNADKRKITLVEYSTNGGPWRRLTQGWPPCVVNVTKKSDGTAITAGSYNLRIRYKTNHEYGFSAASGNAAVTVA